MRTKTRSQFFRRNKNFSVKSTILQKHSHFSRSDRHFFKWRADGRSQCNTPWGNFEILLPRTMFSHIFRQINVLKELYYKLIWRKNLHGSEFLVSPHCGNTRTVFEYFGISLSRFCQKFRERNAFTKEVTIELISRNIFSVRENFLLFHKVTWSVMKLTNFLVLRLILRQIILLNVE